MTPDITQEAIRALTIDQLEQIDAWVRDERKARAEKHKQETLAKIRELARSIEVGIKIEGVRGRPAKSVADAGYAKTVQAQVRPAAGVRS